eukprot:3939927-Rhodomonas_salina.2
MPKKATKKGKKKIRASEINSKLIDNAYHDVNRLQLRFRSRFDWPAELLRERLDADFILERMKTRLRDLAAEYS